MDTTTMTPDLSVVQPGEMDDYNPLNDPIVENHDEILDKDWEYQAWLNEAMERNAADLPGPADFPDPEDFVDL